MTPRWKIKATTVENGFSLHLIGDGDLGKALDDRDSVVVEMEDGSTLPLYEAVSQLIQGRVVGFIVLTKQQCRMEPPPALVRDKTTTPPNEKAN